MTEHDPDPFSTRTKILLDESTESLDAATRSRLRQARNRALEGLDHENSWSMWIPAGALATSVLMVGFYMYQLPPPLPMIYQDPIQQATAENMDLLDDLDFMAWLVLEESAKEDATTNL